MNQLGTQLLALCQQAQHELFLVAPFVKLHTLQRILKGVADRIPVQCVTRWRLDEIAAGVSDIDVWLLIKQRGNATLWLRSDLHAKYYRGDEQALVGSANLTNAALGWSQQSNLELLIDSPTLHDFESALFRGSVRVDDELYEHTKHLIELFPRREVIELLPDEVSEEASGESELVATSPDTWIPTLRHPENLYTAYLGNLDQLGSGSRTAALRDLAAFDVPSGFNRRQFEVYIGHQLLQLPISKELDRFLETSQRFGAVRDFLKTHHSYNTDSINADTAWQTLMRWLLYFLPTRYEVRVFNYSEVFGRK